MAYDPLLTSFVVVGMVGGVAAFLNASADWELAGELALATDRWTAPVIVRRYRNDSTTELRVSREAAVLHRHGYRAAVQRGASGDFTLESAATSDGRSGVAGTRAGETILVTFHLGQL